MVGGKTVTRLIPIALAAPLLAACAAPDPRDVRFPGTIDADYYARYTDQTLTAGALMRCEASSLSASDVLALREAYEPADSYIAYQTLTVTPCVFRGQISHKGKPAKFLWYPSGYLAITYTENAETRTDYFICPGKSDREGVYTCDREHALSRLQ